MMTRILDVSHGKLILHEHRPKGVDRISKVIRTSACEMPRNRDRTVNVLRRDTERRVEQICDKFRRRQQIDAEASTCFWSDPRAPEFGSADQPRRRYFNIPELSGLTVLR